MLCCCDDDGGEGEFGVAGRVGESISGVVGGSGDGGADGADGGRRLEMVHKLIPLNVVRRSISGRIGKQVFS